MTTEHEDAQRRADANGLEEWERQCDYCGEVYDEDHERDHLRGEYCTYSDWAQAKAKEEADEHRAREAARAKRALHRCVFLAALTGSMMAYDVHNKEPATPRDIVPRARAIADEAVRDDS